MIEVFLVLAIILGIIVGFFTGLIPGIHVNTICAILLSLFVSSSSINPELIIAFIASLAITHTFFDVLPGLFLGIPGDSTFALLPGHEMVKKGYGSLAIKLSAIGSISGLGIGLIIFYLLSKDNAMILDSSIKPYLFYVLFGVSVILIFSEKNRINALLVFMASGLLGVLVSATPIIYPREAPINSLLPALTGLFALSGLIWSLFTLENSGDKNDYKDKDINYSEIPGPSIRGGLAGFIVGILPGLGGANAATFLLLIENWLGKKTNKNRKNRSYLITTSSLNTTEAMISIITLYLISKPRSGASIAIGSVLNSNIQENHIQIIITAMIVSGVVSSALIWKIGPIIAKKIHLYDYGALNWSLIAFLSILIGLLLGLGGLTVLCCAFSVGILPFVLDVRKGQLMGFFLLPVLIYYSGEGRAIYDTLLLTQRHSAILSFPASNYIFISIFISIMFGFLCYKYFLKNKKSVKEHQYIAKKLIYYIPILGIAMLLINLLLNN